MKKFAKILLPIVLALLLALSLSIAVFADTSTNEAKIGDTEYATLEAAIDAAQEEETVTLLCDLNRSFTKEISKTLTVDLNGHSITNTNTDATKPMFFINGSDITFTLKGESVITTEARFLQISTSGENSKIIVNGNGSGILVNFSSNEPTVMINNGLGLEATNVHFTITGSRSSGYFPLSSGTMSFKDSTIIASDANSRLFGYHQTGTKFTFENCYASAGKFVFYVDTGIDFNDASFTMLKAENSIFHATFTQSSNLINGSPKAKLKLSGIMEFNNCELMAYRIFEFGAQSGVEELSGGEFEDGYEFTVNVKNSTVTTMSSTGNGSIIRGYAYYNFDNCNIGIMSSGTLGGYTSGDKITLTNCHFNKDVNDNVYLKNSLTSQVLCYDVSNIKFPYLICKAADKPAGQPSSLFYQSLNITANKDSSGNKVPYTGTSAADSFKNGIGFGGEINIKLGSFDSVTDFDGSYVKYTVADLNGNIPKTPTTVKYDVDPYMVIGESSTPSSIPLKGNAVAVIDFDIKLDDFGTAKLYLKPQFRTTTGYNGSGNASFAITSGKIGNASAADGVWHHVQVVITVNQASKTVDSKTCNTFENTTYAVYVDGKSASTVSSGAIIAPAYEKTANGTTTKDYGDLYLQGMRFSVTKDIDMTTGASFSVDNMLLRTYTKSTDFTVAKFTSESNYKAGYNINRNNLVYNGDRYVNVYDLDESVKNTVLYDTGATFVTNEAATSVNIAKANLNFITNETMTSDSFNTILKSGVATANTFYGRFRGWVTDPTATTVTVNGTTFTNVRLGERATVVDLSSGTTTNYYAAYEQYQSSLVAYDKSGKPYMGADNTTEFKTLFEALGDGETVVLKRNLEIKDDTAYIKSDTPKVINFDLGGYTLNKIRKSTLFSDLENVTLNVYSSKVGGTINSRGILTSSSGESCNPFNASDKYYRFNTNFGAAVFNVNKNSTVNLGAYEDYPGSNLTVNAAIMYDATTNSSSAKLNINGGTYVRNVHDSTGLISTRGTGNTINLNNANFLATENTGATILHVANGSSATLTADNCTFFTNPAANNGLKSLFTNHSYQATSTFTNCSFSNMTFTPETAETTSGKTSAKVTLGKGCTFSANCDVTNVTFAGGTGKTPLMNGYKQTFVGGATQLAFLDVYGTSSTKIDEFFYEADVTYHYYLDSSDNYVYVWTGNAVKDTNENTVPDSKNFTKVYGDINTPCNGSATVGYTFDTTSDCRYGGSRKGFSGDATRTAYLVSTGISAPEGSLSYTMPNQAYIVIGSDQDVVTWTVGDTSITKIRDQGDETLPDGISLPSSKAGVYTYSWSTNETASNGVNYKTHTLTLTFDFSLKSNISLNNNFIYNVYVPKALVDSGDLDSTVKLGEDDVALETVYRYEGVDYYLIAIDGISATNGGDSYELNTTVNLGDDAFTDTAEVSFTFSIPDYATRVLADSSLNQESKQMMADVLNYLKLAAIWGDEKVGGKVYTARPGYTDIESALSAYSMTGITPTNTSSVDFSSLAKTPSGVGEAVTGATFNLDTSVNMRFYLAEMYTGTLTLTYKDKNNQNVVTNYEIVNGKCGGKNYVDLELKAYYIANDVTIAFTGQTDSTNSVYNLASYISKSTDNNVTNLTKALYAYANSALAYQNTLG